MSVHSRLSFALGALVLLLPQPSLVAEEFADFRALWVTRFEYSATSPSSVQQVMQNAASMGITDVLFQVRGKADAYYNSNFEPRAERLNGTWDPLQTAIDAAHANGMKLHAWVNSMPLWRDTTAPIDPSHTFYNTNPSFRRFDINGNPEDPQAQSGEYASANPLLPEVHTHLGNVVSDIATNYNVDGVHLDYIRWIGSQAFDTLPHDAQSYSLFNQATGLDGSNPAHAPAYRTFIKDRITDLVGSLKTTVDGVETSTGRNIDLSAAVWRDPDIAENERLQDYRTWLEQDLLDIAMPMIYLRESNSNLLQPNLLNTLNISTNTRVAPGLGVYLHDNANGGVDETISQLSQLHSLGAQGATFFSYGSFFNDPLGSARRTVIDEFYDGLPVPVDPGGNLSPDANVITNFDTDEGYFSWSATHSGSTQGVLGGTIERTETDAHLGSGSQLITIDGSDSGWFLRHLAGIGSPGDPGSNLALDADGFVGFWLKTETPGLTVQVAVDDPGTADRGLAKSIVADGEWRLYEWDLSDDSQWDGWVTGDGVITGPTVTLDSIQFFGSGDAVIYLDTVAHNPLGSLFAANLPGDYDGNGTVDMADYATWRDAYGDSIAEGTGADGNGDGVVNAADYTVWRDALSGSSQSQSVPEPHAMWLVLLGVLAVGGGSRLGGRGRRLLA